MSQSIFCHGCKKFFEKAVCVCIDEEKQLFACPDCAEIYQNRCTICNKMFLPKSIDKVMVGGYSFCKNCIIEVALSGTETLRDLIEIAESDDPKEAKKRKTSMVLKMKTITDTDYLY